MNCTNTRRMIHPRALPWGIAITILGMLTLVLPMTAGAMKVVSDKTITGFKYPESVGYDESAKVLYVSEFGSQLKPTLKDGKGRISKLSLSGKVLDSKFIPVHGEILHKPKGIWVQGNRLWVTDIDSVWVFDTGSRKGKKVALPGIKFANDPTVMGDTLYVSDNRGDQVYTVRPADFLNAMGDPQVKVVMSGEGINPNGVAPARDGSLLMVGFKSKTELRGIYKMTAGGKFVAVSKGLGRLDGVYETRSGFFLITDWNSGSLAMWSSGSGMQTLASGFTGAADFAVFPKEGGLMVVVPDLVKSELRMVHLK